MKWRENEIVLEDELYFVARMLAKAAGGEMTVDKLCREELKNKWIKEYPALFLRFSEHQEARQQSRKMYDKIEELALRDCATPVSETEQTPSVS